MANSKTESKPIRLEFFRILFLLIWYCFEFRISSFEFASGVLCVPSIALRTRVVGACRSGSFPHNRCPKSIGRRVSESSGALSG